jgi:hypothetical protein
MSGSKSKRAGSSYEYRIRNWFIEKGWSSKRIALSGAVEDIGRHDVHAWKNDIYLVIEAKKRTKVADIKKRSQIEIKKEWIDKILFDKDELLVVATDNSPHYAVLPIKRFFQILGRRLEISYDKSNSYSGDKQFVFKRELVDESIDKRYHLQWLGEGWIILLLEEFVTLRETATLEDNLSHEEKIQRLSTYEKAQEYEKLYLQDLNYRQKYLLYSKLEQLESGEMINPLAHANEQFWLKDGEAYVVTCPHCDTNIYKKDLKRITN